MTAALVLALLLAVPVRTRPDPTLTPGAVDPTATVQAICTPGHSSKVRKVPAAVRRERFASYGVPLDRSPHYELDHLISLELGGSNDAKNLWPEFYCPLKATGCLGARQKDVVENYLHREVCAGRMALARAQEIVRRDWLGCFEALQRRVPCSVP